MQNDLTTRVGEAREAFTEKLSAPPKVEPRVAPAPVWALGLPETPTRLHFRRDHYAVPEDEVATVEVGGAVRRPLLLDVAALQELESAELNVVLECAGHRRAELRPTPPGVAWGTGAVSEARWRGTPLRALLRRAGLRHDAIEIVLEGADSGRFPGLSGEHR